MQPPHVNSSKQVLLCGYFSVHLNSKFPLVLRIPILSLVLKEFRAYGQLAVSHNDDDDDGSVWKLSSTDVPLKNDHST